MWKRYWRPETGFFLGLWFILMIGGQSRFFQDPGTFWHTVVGEEMLTQRHLIYRDSFSFTFAGQRWSPHQWLGECLMALLHRIDRFDTLLVTTVTILAALYTWLAHRLLRSGLHWSLAAVVVGLTVAASSSHFHIRSHIATIVFTGLTFDYLCDFEAGRKSLGRLAWLVPMFLFWINVHGGILATLPLMGMAFLYWCGAALLGKPSPIRSLSQAAAFVVLMLACGLTAFINPYGLRLPQIWLEIMAADLPQIIQEHARLDPTKPDGWIVLVFGAIYGLVFLNVRPRWPRAMWLLPLVWFFFACSRIRHAPLFAITAAVAIADMLPYTRWAARRAASGSDLFQFRTEAVHSESGRFAWRPAILPICLILIALILQVGQVPVPVVGHGWARLDPNYWPVELLPQLRILENERPEGTAIFNEYLFGGFLIYHTPGFRVFVDDRCELYGDRWLEEYVRAEWQETAAYIKDCERRYPPFHLALTATGSGFDRFFRNCKEWTLVQETEAASLYRRIAASDRDPSPTPEASRQAP
jgi:hypothetical protein